MSQVFSTPRRRCRRYIVPGRACLRHRDGETSGSLVNIGRCQMLLRAEGAFPEGAAANVIVTLPGYPEGLDVAGTIRGRKDGLLALELDGKTPGVEELLSWLAEQNFPWTLPDTLEDRFRTEILVPRKPPGHPASAPGVQIDDREMEDLLAHLHQLG